MRDAKRRYYLSAWQFDQYDQKVLNEMTLYGLPMYRFSTPLGPAAQPSELELELELELGVGKDSTPVEAHPTNIVITYTAPSIEEATNLARAVASTDYRAAQLPMTNYQQPVHSSPGLPQVNTSPPPSVT